MQPGDAQPERRLMNASECLWSTDSERKMRLEDWRVAQASEFLHERL